MIQVNHLKAVMLTVIILGDFASDLRWRLSINVIPFEIGMSYRDGYIEYPRGTLGKGTNTIEALPFWRSKE